MGNKKISNKMLSEQMMSKIIGEMQNKGLQTEDQIRDFMNGMVG